ncbi:hypothetical protein [Cellulomonas endometrii]|uniref:hypothetical protein n=1 Tax=Cellulomonas endometrii TaxID=3036301 RepID=UPI0024ADD20A|nr:hypothetical protein [Cellulomonas endometrii]
MDPVVEIWTLEEIADRTSSLLAEAGLDLETLRERGEDGMLSPEQWPILRELESLLILVGR